MNAPNPDRRSERARRAILEATLDLCQEVGYDRMTIEAIARRAGVGKQTIYRWWGSKATVGFEAFNDFIGPAADFPDTGDVMADLRQQLTAVAGLFSTPKVMALYTGLIAAAQSDEDARRELLGMLDTRLASCRERLKRAQAEGQLRDDIDLGSAIEVLYGPLYYQLLLHTRPVDPKLVPPLVELAFTGLLPAPSRVPATADAPAR